VGGGALEAGIRRLEKRIASREYQFCKICLGRTPAEEACMNWPGWVCRACWSVAEPLGPGNAVEAMCLAAPDVHEAQLGGRRDAAPQAHAQGPRAGSSAVLLPLRSKEDCTRLRRRVVGALRAAVAGPGLTWKSPRTRVCQICGRVWEIRGLGNLLSAHAGRGEAFCLRCVSRADAERALHENEHRFCVVCLARIPASSVNCHGVSWVCGDCRVEADRLEAPDALAALCQVAADVHEEVPFGTRGGVPLRSTQAAEEEERR
jgi:hypothetical protein